MSRPHTLFGGAMIGTSFTTPEQVQALLDLLKTLGVDRIDTAARYSPTAPGSSECLLGETRAAEQGFTIDTKINTVSGVRAGTLTAAAIEKSLEASLSRLQMSKVNILHFHRPDPQTPIVKQAAEIHRQYLAGRFDKVCSLEL
jgi:aflatoxin B1 aldehyde reductase